jgi:hypothetical protein
MRRKMNLTTIVNLLLLSTMLQIGCEVSTRSENGPGESSKATTSYSSPTPHPTEQAATVKLEDFFGCWSSGSGNVIRISDKQIFYYVKKFRPVNYVVETSEPTVLVLRLIDRPQFYIFQEFISLEIDKDKAPHTGRQLITIRDYLSLEDFNKQIQDGRSGWTKTDCKEWFRS